MSEHKWRSRGTRTFPGESNDVVIYVDEEGNVQITYDVFARLLRELGWTEQTEEPTQPFPEEETA